MNIIYLLIGLVGFIGTYLCIPMFRHMLIDGNIIRPNYKKDMIPVGMGIVFLPMLTINSIILIYITDENLHKIYILLYLFGAISMMFAGALDDIIGNRNVSGLKGHFRSLFKGRLTTGGFKAIFGGIVGLIISTTLSNNTLDIIINTLIIALSTNLMNLLDLRPGRAIKVYSLISIVIFFTSTGFTKILPILLFPNVMSYFIQDIKAKAMMGDTGSNVLGISIGIIVVMNYSFNIRILWLAFLIFIHILTEKYSLTKIIENNKFLNLLDRLGR